MRLIQGRPGGRRPWRHSLIRARSPRCFQRGSCGFETSNPGPIWLSPELLMEASPVANASRFLYCTAAFWNEPCSLRQRDTISDKVARYLGYHVASVRAFSSNLECLKFREYFLQFFAALARSTGIKFQPGCFVLQRQSCACRHGPARQDHLCLGQVRRSDVLFGANARQARRGGDRL